MFLATHLRRERLYMHLHVQHTYEHDMFIHMLNMLNMNIIMLYIQPHFYVSSECASRYSGISLIQTPLGQKNLPLLLRCPDFRGCNGNKQGIRDIKVNLHNRHVLIK